MQSLDSNFIIPSHNSYINVQNVNYTLTIDLSMKVVILSNMLNKIQST